MVGNKRESVNTLKMVGRMARRRFKGLKMTLVELMERQERDSTTNWRGWLQGFHDDAAKSSKSSVALSYYKTRHLVVV